VGIKRYENMDVNNVTNGINAFGEYTTTITKWFSTRALVSEVNGNLKISEKYRVYEDLEWFTFNYTPNMKSVAENQNLHSITWRNKDWRIVETKESNDRMHITLMCYRNDPSVRV